MSLFVVITEDVTNVYGPFLTADDAWNWADDRFGEHKETVVKPVEVPRG